MSDLVSDPVSDLVFGLDLGGTNLKAVAFTGEAKLTRSLTSTRDDGAASFRGAVREAVAELVQKHGEPAYIGLAAPGLSRRDAKAIAFMPGRLQGLENFEWGDFLGFPTRVWNDAQAAMAGEAWLGAAKGCENAFLLTLGTGVGGAILCDGRILRGHIGRAGHLGHLCLDVNGAPDIVNTPGSLEDAIGDHNVKTRSNGRFASTRELVAAFEGGDADAATIWLTSVRALGCAVASLINILDPEKVVLGGGIMAAGDSLFAPLHRELSRTQWCPGGATVEIVAAQLGDFAGAIGAAKLAHPA